MTMPPGASTGHKRFSVRGVGVFAAVLAPVSVGAVIVWAWASTPLPPRPLALHAALGMPHAAAIVAWAYVVPGLAWALSAWRLRRACGDAAALPTRLATQLLLLASLAWVGQGAWPLDPIDVDGPASQRHALAWTLWWLAAAVAGPLLALGLWRAGRRAASALAVVLAAGLLWAVHAAPATWAPAWAEALAVAVWSLGMWLAWRLPAQP
jgi:hypothetical protein